MAMKKLVLVTVPKKYIILLQAITVDFCPSPLVVDGKVHNKKVITPPCPLSCRKKCSEKISEEIRVEYVLGNC